MIHRIAALCLLLGSAPAMAQANRAASSEAAKSGPQQLFDAGTRAFEAGDWPTAEKVFAQLQGMLPSTSKALPVVRARRGFSLARLGRDQDAIVELEAGLKALPVASDTVLDRSIAHRALGGLYLARAQSGAARANLQRALDSTSDPKVRLAITVELASASMFLANSEALLLFTQSIAEADRIGWQDAEKASLYDLYARALLNAGDRDAALRQLQKALSLVGGMTGTINVRSMPILSDLALANLLMGRQQEAVRYVAFSGAGLGKGGDLPFPDLVAVQKSCGEELKPNDFGIVQFGLRDDGSVADARTVYANRLGPVADNFSDLVNNWRWKPETVKALGPVRRAALRVEVRCSIAYGPGIVGRAMRAEWFNARGFGKLKAGSSLQDLRNELKAREASFGANSGQLVPVLSAIASESDADDDETARSLRRAIEIAAREKSPKGTLAELYAALLSVQFPTDHNARITATLSLMSDPTLAWDDVAKGYLRFKMSGWYGLLPFPNPRSALLKQLVEDRTIPDNFAYKREAMEDYARVLAADGKHLEAIAIYKRAQTGFLPCSIAGLRRKTQRSLNYPALAEKWGVSGWAYVGVNVRSDLKADETRVLSASPPLIFSDVRIRFPEDQQVSLPLGVSVPDGCREYQTRVRFDFNGD